MPTHKSSEDMALEILNVFKALSDDRPGTVLQYPVFFNYCIKRGFAVEDLHRGMEAAIEKGWVEAETEKGPYKLME